MKKNISYYRTNDLCFAYVYDYKKKKYYLGTCLSKNYQEEFINYFNPLQKRKYIGVYNTIEFNTKKEMLHNFNNFTNTINYNNKFYHNYTNYTYNDLEIEKRIRYKNNITSHIWNIYYTMEIKESLNKEKLTKIKENLKDSYNFNIGIVKPCFLSVSINGKTRKEVIQNNNEFKKLIAKLL